MKTRLLVIIGVILIGVFSFVVFDNSSNISSFFQTSFPAHVKNNPISHHFMILDIQNTNEYRTDCLKKTANDYFNTNLTSLIRIHLDNEVYNTNDVIVLSGSTDRMIPDTEIIMTIFDPLENIIAISQTSVVDDKFVGRFQIEGSLWEQNGIYTITVHYGEKSAELEFLFLSGLDPDKLL